MEGFTYTNIFDTKGLEYLAIISFFLILIPFWMFLSKPVKIPATLKKTLGFLTAGAISIPQGLFFSKHHSWAYLEKSGLAKVGVDDFLMKVIGEVKFVVMKNYGERVRKGEVLAIVSQNGKTLNLISPISGEIIVINDSLAKHPEVLLEDPYTKGWFYKIKPENWVSETSNSYFAEDALSWIEQEVIRFKDFLAATLNKNNGSGSSQMVLQDGGELFAQPLQLLPIEVWNAFQNDFLENKIQVTEFERYSES